MTRLEQTISAAKLATLDLVRLMVAHDLNPETLTLLLEPGWPMPVKRAYENWVLLMDEVAKAMAAEDGRPEVGETFKERLDMTARAFAAVMD